MVINYPLFPYDASIGRTIRKEESLEYDLLDWDHEEAYHSC